MRQPSPTYVLFSRNGDELTVRGMHRAVRSGHTTRHLYFY